MSSFKNNRAPFFTIMWDHTDGCAKHYLCVFSIHLLSCIALGFSIIIDRSVGSPGHVKDVVYGINTGDKRMPKLAITKILILNEI